MGSGDIQCIAQEENAIRSLQRKNADLFDDACIYLVFLRTNAGPPIN